MTDIVILRGQQKARRLALARAKARAKRRARRARLTAQQKKAVRVVRKLRRRKWRRFDSLGWNALEQSDNRIITIIEKYGIRGLT